MWEALGWGALAASSLVVGAALALVRSWSDTLVGLVLGFGAGALIASVSFELAEEGLRVGGAWPVALGLVLGATPGRWSQDATVAVAVGFLGAFTTFSAFSYETQVMLRQGRPGSAAAYVLTSLLGGVGAAALGWAAGRALVG